MDTAKATALLKQAQAGLTSLQQTVADALAQLAPGPTPTPAPSPVPAPVKVGRVPDSVSSLVPGLDYTYYEGNYSKLPTFSKEKSVASGTTDRPTLELRKRSDGYALRFACYYLATTDGEYGFSVASDDGSRLLIGDKVVVDNDAIQGTTKKSGKITLQKGYHLLVIEYFNYGGPQELIMSHTPPSSTEQVIPASLYARVPAAKPATPSAAPTIDGVTATIR